MELVLSSREALGRGPEVVGGKAAALARLADARMPVPSFFVIPAAAFAAHLQHNGLDWSSEPDSLRASIVDAPLPGRVAVCLEEAMAEMPPRVAVRSSGVLEDSSGSSFAGQFESFLSIEAAGLEEAVKACWVSSISERSIDYRAERGLTLEAVPQFAVIVQAQIFSRASGVLYTVSPLDRRCAYLEANYGTGESVVGSLASPDGYTVDRETGTLEGVHIGSKRRATMVGPDFPGSRVEEVDPARRRARVLDDVQAEDVYRLGMRAEELMSCPQDVEWTFDETALWLLQSRPITAAA